MSYQVLARKYRPKSFETLVGQEHVVRALSHALDQQRLHHAYLFTGTRGVGKTTLSRILAKSFNCEKGITSTPCGDCDTCVAIDAGRFVDYIEMDAASNRGVDEMAALLEQAIYAPTNARYKVYMIDEVHMLTNHAFNAMLKTLEEPPAHVKFILATTDPQKIPMTVLSRCLQFNLKQMPPGHIINHLENILGQEQIDFDTPALRLLAQGAHGSMRDALSLTDQAIAYAAGKVTLDAVQSMLGALDQSYLIRLLDALAAEDGKALLDVADEMAARSLSYKAALQDLGTLLNQMAIAQLAPTALGEELPERDQLLRLAGIFSKEEVQLFYQIVVHGRNEIGLAPDEYAGFTMTLLRMLAFRPSTVDAQIASGGASQKSPAKSANLMRPSTVAQMSAPVHRATEQTNTDTIIAEPANFDAIKPTASIPATNAVATNNAVSNTAQGAKPLSPAMAALAAARAGSQRAAQGLNRGQSTVATPVVETTLPAPITEPIKQKIVEPEVKVAAIIKEQPLAANPVNNQMEAEDNEMPPPWEEDDFSSVAATSHQYYSTVHDERQPSDVVVKHVAMDEPQVVAPVVVQEAIQEIQKAVQEIQEVHNQEVVISKVVKPLELSPVIQLDWDGNWPLLAATLPVRGVAQQLAQQSELQQCVVEGNAIVFKLCVPLQTLLSSGSEEKLVAALKENFSKFAYNIRVETAIGAVEQTANAHAVASKAERQLLAEQQIKSDSFVQTLIRDFGASILTGSIKPI